jgi:deoxyribodipyrimidine photo-lyase
VIHNERIEILKGGEIPKKGYILYWMQASQRAVYNHALEYAISVANERQRPLIVYFGITDNFPEANERHYRFMLEGLSETKATLKDRFINMVIRHEAPDNGILRMAQDASLVVVDTGYLQIQRKWREYVAAHIDCPFIQVETDIVVPIKQASIKEEYSAATLRPKIGAVRDNYLVPLEEHDLKKGSLSIDLEEFDISDISSALSSLTIDRSVKPVSNLRGGTNQAQMHLADFIEHKLEKYTELRNDPNVANVSNMSPYLHFGQISPLYITLKILETGRSARDAYLEELIVRRELSMNFVFYNPYYDSFYGIPSWSRKTLVEHEDDRRDYLYSLRELECAQTHDPYWNAAQREMMLAGKMHGYMRMYWGKKILEWSAKPEDAFSIALYLNNKYELDGRDTNSFAGVAWCFGKHDRPWGARTIFGNIRYMSAGGLKRKFDADSYASKDTDA